MNLTVPSFPKGVTIHPFSDRTNLVNTTLHTVSHTLLEGMILVVLVLIIFLGNWRGALLVALTIPLSLLIAFILMHVTGIPANLLSLGAIDFGILVDGAIVMMENHSEEKGKQSPCSTSGRINHEKSIRSGSSYSILNTDHYHSLPAIIYIPTY